MIEQEIKLSVEEILAGMQAAEEQEARPRPVRKAAERGSNRTPKERARTESGETKNQAINIRVSPMFKAIVAKASKERKVSTTVLIEQAVKFYLEHGGKA
jgi:hypothetical protein